jgi:CBS domain containing-hemolysin-like protein
MMMFFQILVVLVLVGFGGFFAGSETGVYRLSRLSLRLGIEQKRPFFALLGRIMDDSSGLVFSMLIANNLVHYIVTSIVTGMFLCVTLHGHRAELYATLILAPVLFIFSEVIPKNVYYHRSDVLMVRFAPMLWFFHKIFTWSGAVGVLKFLSGLAGRALKLPAETSTAMTAGRREHIRELIAETREEGILSPVQNAIMNRLVNISYTPISSVMTAAGKVEAVDVQTDRAALMAKLRKCAYTRLPVFEDDRNNVIGFVNVYEALGSGGEFGDVRDFVKPIVRFSPTISVIEAINRMMRGNHKIVLVGPAHYSKRIVGIVTMKDLVEEFTGELAQW